MAQKDETKLTECLGLLGGGGGVSGEGVVVWCQGATVKRWNWRQPCRRRRDPNTPETDDVIGRFGKHRRCIHALIEVIRRSISSRRLTKRSHLFSVLFPPGSDAVVLFFEYPLPMASGSVISTRKGGPFKSVPASSTVPCLH